MNEFSQDERLHAHAPVAQAPQIPNEKRDLEPWACQICVRVEDVSAWMFPDDRFGVCRQCGKPVQFRPHGPKRPPLVCLQCALDLVRAGRA